MNVLRRIGNVILGSKEQAKDLVYLVMDKKLIIVLLKVAQWKVHTCNLIILFFKGYHKDIGK